MKKKDLAREHRHSRQRIRTAIAQFEARISGTRGAEAARDRFAAALDALSLPLTAPQRIRRPLPQSLRYRFYLDNLAHTLALNAGQDLSRHNRGSHYDRGDHHTVCALDTIAPHDPRITAPPYCDLGGAGMALIRIDRKRVYAKASTWGPSYASTSYIVGRNESGTYYAHPVPSDLTTLIAALDWMWAGYAADILQRQGDIALIAKISSYGHIPALPAGHTLSPCGTQILHVSHAPLPMPQRGQRILVARRATTRVSEATRD